jgi:hypothetical protein
LNKLAYLSPIEVKLLRLMHHWWLSLPLGSLGLHIQSILCCSWVLYFVKPWEKLMFRSRVRGVVGHDDRVGVMFVYVLPDVGTRGRVGMFLLGDQYDFAPAKV